MKVETEGYEAGVSWCLYGLVGLATLTVVSPLIVISMPLLILLGPIAVSSRVDVIRHHGSGEVGASL